MTQHQVGKDPEPVDWAGFPGMDGPTPSKQPSTEDMVREIHGWLSEIMPAARVAMKMMNARSALTARWRGGKDAK